MYVKTNIEGLDGITCGKLYECFGVDHYGKDKFSFEIFDDLGRSCFCLSLECAHLYGADWIVFPSVPNRDFLRDFVKMNNIKTSKVSKALGKSQNWLTQMMNDKRRDMTDATLKSIMKQLHIDWASNEFLHVRSEVPYRTRPSNYTTTQHKERLQRDFWNGMATK